MCLFIYFTEDSVLVLTMFRNKNTVNTNHQTMTISLCFDQWRMQIIIVHHHSISTLLCNHPVKDATFYLLHKTGTMFVLVQIILVENIPSLSSVKHRVEAHIKQLFSEEMTKKWDANSASTARVYWGHVYMPKDCLQRRSTQCWTHDACQTISS